MGMRIRLLGPPGIEFEGDARELAGRKTWAMLAYLLLEPRAPTRRELAERLWPGADDPLAALRWSLLQVRRAMAPLEIREERGRMQLTGARPWVDAEVLIAGPLDPGSAEDLAGGEFLEGFSFPDAPAFDAWLTLQRSRLGAAATDALRWAASVLARRDPERALRLAERAALLNAFDDGVHELIVDIHVGRGDRTAAEEHIARVARLYRDELATEAPGTIRRPLDRPPPPSGGPLVRLDIAARTLLDAAVRKLDAGDYDGALDSARRAAADAVSSGDKALEARALLVLAGALIHSLRGHDRESLGLLAHALGLAETLGDAALIADVEREVGFVELLNARYGAAESALARSTTWAERAGDPSRAARAQTYLGLCRSDRADFGGAQESLRGAITALDGADNRAFRGYALGCLARVFLRTGVYDEAIAHASEGVADVRASGHIAVLPWPMVHEGEAAMRAGDETAAAALFGEAFTLACDMRDPCWEALSLRGLALLEAANGDPQRARSMLEDALARNGRHPDAYRWAEALILTDLVELDGGEDRGRLDAALALARQGPMADLAAKLSSLAGQAQTPAQTSSL
jgi:DNA-binding SARP family transcriptional activator